MWQYRGQKEKWNSNHCDKVFVCFLRKDDGKLQRMIEELHVDLILYRLLKEG